MKYVAFIGSKQSGKTTGFNFVKANFSNVAEITLASRLKEVCSKVFEVPLNYMYDDQFKERELEIPVTLTSDTLHSCFLLFDKKPGVDYTYDSNIRPFIGTTLETPRRILQYVGTEVLRKIDDSIHLNYAVSNKAEKADIYVITDIRFENEFEFFNANYKDDFFPFYVDNKKAESIADVDSHASEQGYKQLKSICTPLNNNRSLSDYEELIKNKVGSLI